MRFLETLRVVLISPEFLALLCVVASYFYVPTIFEGLGDQFKTNTDIWKFIPTIPFAICGFSIQYAWKILFPKDGTNNSTLLHWPNYWKLKLRVFVSVAICVFCVLGALSIWICCSILPSNIIGTIFITSILLSSITAINQLLAAFMVWDAGDAGVGPM